jgi:hypothetical protein
MQGVIYDRGPKEIIEVKRDDETKARIMLEQSEWPDEKLKEQTLDHINLMQSQKSNLRWIHIPADHISILLHSRKSITNAPPDEMYGGKRLPSASKWRGINEKR